jgi:two-component system, NarL family, nitrate/nitrite response regulator NarL
MPEGTIAEKMMQDSSNMKPLTVSHDARGPGINNGGSRRAAATVLLVARTGLLRDMISRTLGSAGFVIVGEGTYINGSIAGRLHSDAAWHSDLVILHVEDEAISGDALRQLRTTVTGKIVLLIPESRVESITQDLITAVDGILSDDLSADALVQALAVIQQGERVVPRQLAQFMVTGGARLNLAQPSNAQFRNASLSRRETEILLRVVLGESNKVIAHGLNITEATVKVHLKSILRKISVQNRTQAAIWAVNNGLDQKPV